MDKSEEKSIIRAVSILGGTQACNIAVGIIRNKAVSILIGAAGMGSVALYQSTSDLITTISNVGISTTAVKNISSANMKKDNDTISYVISAFRKIVVVTGLLAAFICVSLSPILSYINFGDYNHIFDFVLLSLSLIEIQLVAGYTTLLQGCRKFKLMAEATLAGNIIGLLVCVPLYYFFGFKAIVPVLIFYPMINYCVLLHVTRKIGIKSIHISYREALHYGRNMIKTGFFICLQSLSSMLYIYILRLYLSNSGGLIVVGLFSSGMLLVNQYVGLVFSSMGTEYYPRLAGIEDDSKFIRTINMQMKRCMYFLAPLLSIMILCMPLVIRILYTEEFLPVVSFAILMLASVCFKIIEWCIGFSFIAKGKTCVLFFNEFSFKVYLLVLSILFYNHWGLVGIGIAYLVAEFFFSVQSLAVIQKLWNFTFQEKTLYTLCLNILLVGMSLLLNLYYKGFLGYSYTICIIIVEFFFLVKYLKSLK